MTAIRAFESTQQSEIQAAAQSAQAGRFYHFRRAYLLSVDEKVHTIALNVFQRLYKFVVELFGRDYFAGFFPGKKVEVLDPTTLTPVPNASITSSTKAPTIDYQTVLAHCILRDPREVDLARVKELAPKVMTKLQELAKPKSANFIDPETRRCLVVRGNALTTIVSTCREKMAVLHYLVLTEQIAFTADWGRGNIVVAFEMTDHELDRELDGQPVRKIDKTTILKREEEIKDRTISPLKDVPAEVKEYVEKMVVEINQKLPRYAERGDSPHPIAVLGNRWSEAKADKALDCLVEQGKIHSYNRTRGSYAKLLVALQPKDEKESRDHAFRKWRDFAEVQKRT